MANKKENKGNGVKTGLAIAAGLGAVAGAYFLYGTEAGKKKRKAIKGWMLKAKGEVLEKIENMKDLSEEKYKDAVMSVMKKYDKFKEKYGDEAAMLYSELMAHWKQIQKHASAKKGSKKSKSAKSKKTAKK
ncbi:MAG TPA: hypothetical protein VEC13_02570 [Candidatus Paceibacterota bacterium]|nr:hypothetical protein [Candidatus Paceibacterota bacterium]